VLCLLLLGVQALATGHGAACDSGVLLQQLVREVAQHPNHLLLAHPLALPCMQHTLRQALLCCCRQGLGPALQEGCQRCVTCCDAVLQVCKLCPDGDQLQCKVPCLHM
jgi:hypothetical protein